MPAIDKARTRLTSRFWPATAAVDVATMDAAIAAAMAGMQEQVNGLVVRNMVDRIMGRAVAQAGDVENQFGNLHVE